MTPLPSPDLIRSRGRGPVRPRWRRFFRVGATPRADVRREARALPRSRSAVGGMCLLQVATRALGWSAGCDDDWRQRARQPEGLHGPARQRRGSPPLSTPWLCRSLRPGRALAQARGTWPTDDPWKSPTGDEPHSLLRHARRTAAAPRRAGPGRALVPASTRPRHRRRSRRIAPTSCQLGRSIPAASARFHPARRRHANRLGAPAPPWTWHRGSALPVRLHDDAPDRGRDRAVTSPPDALLIDCMAGRGASLVPQGD
jgi:hypothetical protein